MNSLIQRKKTIPLIIIVLSFAYFTLSPTVQAVVPAPDGGYPGGNTAEGQSALLSLTTGGFNTAVGFFSLRSNTTGQFNTAVGAGTLLANTADDNTATGAGALLSNTTGSSNTANGVFSLFSNTTGFANTADGAFALNNNTTGPSNTANGADALLSNTTGSGNTAIGSSALQNNSTGSNNIALGTLAGINVTTATGVISIGADGNNVPNSCFIGRIRGATTVNNDAIPVVIDSAGQLGTISSSVRFKKDIRQMDKASEAIMALKPVIFHYKSDNTNRPEFGLIAEEVAEVNPDLVVRDKEGKPYTVRYDAVNAMLLNEFLKEHKRVEEQQAQIAALNSRVATQEAMIAQQQAEFRATTIRQGNEIHELTASLKQQAAQVQNVSAQLDLSNAAPQVVANGP